MSVLLEHTCMTEIFQGRETKGWIRRYRDIHGGRGRTRWTELASRETSLSLFLNLSNHSEHGSALPVFLQDERLLV